MKSSYKVFLKKVCGGIAPPWGVSSHSGDRLRPQWSWSIEGVSTRSTRLYDSSPPVQVSLCVFLQRWGRFVFVKGSRAVGCGRVGIRGEVSACKVNKREPRIPFSLASERSPLLCFRYGYMALILKIQEFHFGFADMKEKEEKTERKGKYTVCFTWYVSPPSPGLPAVILTVMDDSQCWAVCETVWQLQQFVWYSHIRWPKSCIYTKSQVISYKNYNS